jgi:[acyl-carrier-protein] S-malonyltransferase
VVETEGVTPTTERGKIALMFPGQGSQHVGMGADLARAYPVARRTFEEANDVLGFDLAAVCFEGPVETLLSTRHCQPAVLTTSVAAWRVAQEEGLRGDLTLGHSLGEYAALVASGALDFPSALRLVQQRGEATDLVAQSVPGSMAALLGATEEEAERLCAEAGDVWPANYNCPGQIVASGLHRGVDRLLDLARASGVKVRRLDVEGAFHSSVMAPAADRLREALGGVRVHAPSLPFLSATSAAVEAGTERVKQILTQQLTAPVRFTQAVRAAMDMGTSDFVELGPRRVLVGLVRRIRPDVRVHHLGGPDDIPAIAALARG